MVSRNPRRPEGEFATLYELVNDMHDQVARLHRLEDLHLQWEQAARQEIKSIPNAAVTHTHMLARKQKMDNLRAQVDEFSAGNCNGALRMREGIGREAGSSAPSGKNFESAAQGYSCGSIASSRGHAGVMLIAMECCH